MKFRTSITLLTLLALSVMGLWLFSGPAQAQKAKPKENKTYSLFDGKTLKGWKVTDFGGQGEVETKKKQILIPLGQDMSGITYDPKTSPLKIDLPKENYEINLEAMRVDGSDFFCGMTFPVGDEFCSLILGGWGGGVVGLSSIHGFDASENDTTQYVEFENKKWYKVRLRVTTKKISVWLDDKQIIDLPRKDNEFSIRFEMELNKPLGFATWQTIGALRNISLTVLEEPEAEEEATEKPADEKQKKADKKKEKKKDDKKEADKSAEEKPMEAKPAVEEPKAEEPAPGKPKAEKPKKDKPKAEKPAAEEAAPEKPQADKPKKEKPKQEKPKQEKSQAEKPKVEEPAVEQRPVEKGAVDAADEGDNEASPSDRPIEASPSDRPIEKPQPEPAEVPVDQPPVPETPDAVDTGCVTMPAASYAEACCVPTSCRKTRCKVRYWRGCRSFRRCR